jgi:O-acetyl-ADP-ribose deacetylase (regulator of RNase III)
MLKKSGTSLINNTEVKMEFSKEFEGGRVFKVGVFDLLGVNVDAIINPANSGLSHGGGLAAAISDEAGPELERQCEMAIEKIGRIPVTQNVVTTAGRLPYKGVIHAVGPRMGDGNEQSRIERTVINCLRRADGRGWKSVALPAISTGLFCVPMEVCAEAFGQAVPRYWQEYPSSSVELIWLCLTIDAYPVFEKILSRSLR